MVNNSIEVNPSTQSEVLMQPVQNNNIRGWSADLDLSNVHKIVQSLYCTLTLLLYLTCQYKICSLCTVTMALIVIQQYGEGSKESMSENWHFPQAQ